MDGMSWSHRMGSRVSLAIALGIGVALTGCSSYGSRTEARIACQQWKEGGPRFRYEGPVVYKELPPNTLKPGEIRRYDFGELAGMSERQIVESNTRSCETEETTKQVLGWVRIPPKGWDHVYPDRGMRDWERVVSKRFRWPSR